MIVIFTLTFISSSAADEHNFTSTFYW